MPDGSFDSQINLWVAGKTIIPHALEMSIAHPNPIQSNAFRRAQVVLFARILHTFDHIQIGVLPVPIRSALKSNKTS